MIGWNIKLERGWGRLSVNGTLGYLPRKYVRHITTHTHTHKYLQLCYRAKQLFIKNLNTLEKKMRHFIILGWRSIQCVNSHWILLSPLIYVKANLVSHHRCFSFILMLKIYFSCKIVHFHQPGTQKTITFSSSRIFIKPRCHQAENLQTQFWLSSAGNSEECPIRQQWISTGTADRFLTVSGREKHRWFKRICKDFCCNPRLNQ